MEGYLQLLDLYNKSGRLKILLHVFMSNIFESKKLLWASWLAVLFIMSIATYQLNSWLVVVAIIPAFIGSLLYKDAIYTTYDELLLIPQNKRLAEEYALNYQGLRYLLFKGLSFSITGSNIDSAIKYLDIKENTDSTSSVRNHWVIVGLLTVLSITIGALFSSAPEKLLVLLAFSTVVIILYTSLFLQVIVSQKDKDLEFRRFLLWLKEQS